MNKRSQVPQYARISLVAFLCCLAILLLLILGAEKLTSLGLIDRLYYLVLVLMGMTAAVFLFGILPSSAEYEGKLLGGTLKLSGPVLGAALVVVGGYYFAPSASTFSLTVYVHGEGGPQDVILRDSGTVVLELGPETKSAQIGEHGQAYFPAIPANFRGQQVPAWVESESYESVDPGTKQRLDGSALYLTVCRKIRHYNLAGTITDQAGDPLPGVRIVLPEYQLEKETDGNGRFEFQVDAEGQRMLDLVAQKQGYKTAHLSPTLGDTGLTFSLQRSK